MICGKTATLKHEHRFSDWLRRIDWLRKRASVFTRKDSILSVMDNDMRARFFGAEASTALTRIRLEKSLKNYRHENVDIRDQDGVNALFAKLGSSLKVIIHTAAQPSHDWAAREPHTDFSVNAVGTLNLLEVARQHCPEAVFIFTSTNKVYGDRPNQPAVARTGLALGNRSRTRLP